MDPKRTGLFKDRRGRWHRANGQFASKAQIWGRKGYEASRVARAEREARRVELVGWKPAKDEGQAWINWKDDRLDPEFVDALARQDIEIFPSPMPPAELMRMADKIKRGRGMAKGWVAFTTIVVADQPMRRHVARYVKPVQPSSYGGVDIPVMRTRYKHKPKKKLKKPKHIKGMSQRGRKFEVYELEVYRYLKNEGKWDRYTAAAILDTAAGAEWGRARIKRVKK